MNILTKVHRSKISLQSCSPGMDWFHHLNGKYPHPFSLWEQWQGYRDCKQEQQIRKRANFAPTISYIAHLVIKGVIKEVDAVCLWAKKKLQRRRLEHEARLNKGGQNTSFPRDISDNQTPSHISITSEIWDLWVVREMYGALNIIISLPI